ncbi:MAG: uroporphyrinogen decarboxylase family protein, partial [Anaerolineae bacterium]
QNPESLAQATLAFQGCFDFDFIKVSPSNAFCAADWGSKTVYRGNENGTREYIAYAIKEAKGWQRLKPLDVTRGVLGEQLECLRHLHREIGGRIPFIQTLFNPLMVAKYLAGPEFIVHLRRYPREFKRALSVIGETMSEFAKEAIRAGADGIFLAVQHASYDLLSEGEYREFGIPYDLQILEAASDGWFNLLHIHGKNIMLDLLSDYPVEAVNWHTRTASPTLREAQGRFSGALVGGLGRHSLVCGSPEDVKTQVKEAIAQTEGRGLIVAAGCVVPITAPEINIRVAREAVELPHQIQTGGY